MFGLKIAKTTILEVSDRSIFFRENKADYSVFRGEIYRGLLCCYSHSIIILGSQSKVEKTKFFLVFSTFDRVPETIMHGMIPTT